jgi:hypothetical protein
VGDHGTDLGLADPRALEAPRVARGGREQQQITLADQPLGAGLIEDDTAVGQ